jgi:hypothetical protein
VDIAGQCLGGGREGVEVKTLKALDLLEAGAHFDTVVVCGCCLSMVELISRGDM